MSNQVKIIMSNVLMPPEEIPDDVTIGTLQQWDSLGHLNLMLELESHSLTYRSPEKILKLALQSVE